MAEQLVLRDVPETTVQSIEVSPTEMAFQTDQTWLRSALELDMGRDYKVGFLISQQTWDEINADAPIIVERKDG